MPFITVDGCDIYYEEWGTGVPLVLTPGGLSPASTMLPLVDRLADKFRVIIWDRPNQGMSQIAIRGPSELDLCANALAVLLEAINAGPAFLAAPSEGSRVSLRAALRTPELVRGLFFWQMSAGPVVEWLRSEYHDKYADMAMAEGMDAVARTPWYHERIKYNPSNRERLLSLDATEFAATKRLWAKELEVEHLVPGHTEDQVRKLAMPVWVVAGVDETHPPEAAARVAEVVEQGRMIPAPYGPEEWDRVLHIDVEANSPYVLYSTLPGVSELIEDFISTSTAASPVPTELAR
jgi:2-hydroxy-6-oxonona-2,4-dienedioate hydrolase